MTVKVINTYTTGTVGDSSYETLIVTSSGTIEYDDIYAVSGSSNSTLVVQGSVIGDQGFFDAGQDDTISVALGGMIMGLGDDAILIDGDHDRITNAGSIEGVGGNAISVGSNSILNNSGVISAEGRAFYGQSDETIINTGTLSSSGEMSTIEINADNTLINNGVITGSESSNYVINFGSNSNSIMNYGTIAGQNCLFFNDGTDNISNSGVISGIYSAIFVTGSAGLTTINNTGLIEVSSSPFDDAISIQDTGGSNKLNNAGKIVGGVSLGGNQSQLINSGTITGDLRFESLDEMIYNSGTINGDIVFDQGGSSFWNSGTITGYVDFAAADVSAINTGLLDGTIIFEAAGGTLRNSGQITYGVLFNDGNAFFKNTGIVDYGIAFKGNNNYYNGLLGEALDGVVCSGTSGTYLGGANGTLFQITSSDLTSDDTITGGASADDILTITDKGSVTAHALKHVSGFETIYLESAIQIVINQHVADTAAGSALTIDTQSSDTVDLRARFKSLSKT